MNAEIRNLVSFLSHKSLSKSIHCPVYKFTSWIYSLALALFLTVT